MTVAVPPPAGARAPDLTLATAEGAAVRLSDFWTAAPRALALALVRHFG